MSIEANKEVVRRFYEEGWNQQNPDRFDELMDEQYAAWERAWAKDVWAAFPDAHFVLDDLIAEGDSVVARLTWSGTHAGEFWGVSPTGSRLSVECVWIYRIANGRILWEGRYGLIDMLGWKEQLGLVSAPQ